MRFASVVSNGVQQLLEGSTDPDPQQHGMTTDEERIASRLTQVSLEQRMGHSVRRAYFTR